MKILGELIFTIGFFFVLGTVGAIDNGLSIIQGLIQVFIGFIAIIIGYCLIAKYERR